VPHDIDRAERQSWLRLPIVTEGSQEILDTYTILARSFAEQKESDTTPHVEFLIDKQGYIRARWLPAESEAWRKIATLLAQVELLRKEKPRAPAPDEHVH
jgi:putative copper resistance protein D